MGGSARKIFLQTFDFRDLKFVEETQMCVRTVDHIYELLITILNA